MINPFETIDARLSNIESLLLDLKHSAPKSEKQNDPDELLTVQGAAEFLSLSVPTVYGLISKGELPVMKRSKRCYFSRKDLMAYVRQGRKKTVRETDQAAHDYLNTKTK